MLDKQSETTSLVSQQATARVKATSLVERMQYHSRNQYTMIDDALNIVGEIEFAIGSKSEFEGESVQVHDDSESSSHSIVLEIKKMEDNLKSLVELREAVTRIKTALIG